MDKGFDAVAWMRQRRVAIDKEDEGLTWKERSEKTVKLVQGDPLWEHLRGRIAQPPVLAPRQTAEGK